MAKPKQWVSDTFVRSEEMWSVWRSRLVPNITCEHHVDPPGGFRLLRFEESSVDHSLLPSAQGTWHANTTNEVSADPYAAIGQESMYIYISFMTMLHDRLEALRDLCYKSSPLLLDITTQTLHGTAIYAYIGVVSGVNVGIYIYGIHGMSGIYIAIVLV